MVLEGVIFVFVMFLVMVMLIDVSGLFLGFLVKRFLRLNVFCSLIFVLMILVSFVVVFFVIWCSLNDFVGLKLRDMFLNMIDNFW